jgi:hypothetical protein
MNAEKKNSPTNFLNKNEIINALKATPASAADHPHARPRLSFRAGWMPSSNSLCCVGL